MEPATRKRLAEGGEEARRTRSRGGEEVKEERDGSETDDKVDEFFAILSRIRKATRCFPVRDGHGGLRRRSTAADRWRWKPKFQREDFEEASGVGDGGRWRGSEEASSSGEAAAEEERVAENTIPGSLDLNADPALERPGLGSPGGDSTPPVAS